MPHAAPSWLYLLLVPVVIWIRVWRARRSAQASDLWFEPEGDHFIYHPFGRFGAAYLVSAVTREAIRAKTKLFTQLAAAVFVVAAVGPICLMSLNFDLYTIWRPWIVPIRIGIFLSIIPIGILWRIVAIRPLYAGSGLAPRRISAGSVHEKRATARSWWSVGLALGLLISLSVLLFYDAYTTDSAAYAAYGSGLAILAVLNLRTVMTKIRLRGS